MVTKVAITTMNAGIRTLSGIKFFNSEITTFEHTSTKVVASPMDIPLIAEVVVAKVGHIPSTNAKTGFSRKIPFNTVLKALFFSVGLLPQLLIVLHRWLPRLA